MATGLRGLSREVLHAFLNISQQLDPDARVVFIEVLSSLGRLSRTACKADAIQETPKGRTVWQRGGASPADSGQP
jgi:hypothetical protein